MTTTRDILSGLLDNLKVDNAAAITARRDEITKSLNREFRALEAAVTNRLMVGSYGRRTAIKGISDLDLLFILPTSLRDSYEKDGGASKILTRTREAIERRYPNTVIKVDRLVVVVEFANFMFEVQPVFENADGSFSYPDTSSDSWKITRPRDEIKAIAAEDEATHGVVRVLCKLARAWRNKHGVVMGGLLIDTLAYNFISDHDEHRSATIETFGEMAHDFFEYLAEESDHEFYAALGSRQRVRVKKRFQRKAKKARELSRVAINADGQKNAYKKWRAVFGNAVPALDFPTEAALSASAFTDTEQFIEDFHRVDIRRSLTIDCTVTQDGFRPQSLREILSTTKFLRPRHQLTFKIKTTDVSEPYEVKWKVLNRGAEAERRNNVRGQIVSPTHGRHRRESTSFRGPHSVECYIIKNGVVLARDEIDVPIAETAV